MSAIQYCRIRFDSDGLTTEKIAIVRLPNRDYILHNLYRSCLLIYGIAIIFIS